GDWDLEVSSGSIEATTFAPTDIDSYNHVLATDVTFDFESDVSGYDSHTVTQTKDGVTLVAESTDQNLVSSLVSSAQSGELSTDFGNGYESSVTFSLSEGQSFDLSSLSLKDWDESESIVITS
ncbi:hypothetical protein C4K68_24245, partial [Pokkaliibacter plantistimulans]